jgi:hypothetical protein
MHVPCAFTGHELNKPSPSIVLVAAGLVFSSLLVSCTAALPTPTATPTVTPTPAPITYDPALTQPARQLFTATYVCDVCHSINSLRMTAGGVGPDLSGALFAIVPADTPPELNPLKQWYETNGLPHPEADPAKAAELLTAFLVSPPDYAPTKQVQIAAFKELAGGDAPWLTDVKALVELLKEAASKR